MVEFWVDPKSPYFKDIFGQEKRFVFHCASGWRSALTVATLKEMGFETCANDNCLLKRKNELGNVFISLYVDDLMCVGDKQAVMKAVEDIQRVYKIKINNEEDESEFVGVTYEKDGDKILISQPDTIKKLDKKFGDELKESKKYQTPAAAGETITRIGQERSRILQVFRRRKCKA